MFPSMFFLHQLAQDEGSPVRGFGVVEYESAEQAEAVLTEMDRTLVGGQEVRLSLCSPGTSGRSTLAALIAAQGMVSMMPAEHLAHILTLAHTHRQPGFGGSQSSPTVISVSPTTVTTEVIRSCDREFTGSPSAVHQPPKLLVKSLIAFVSLGSFSVNSRILLFCKN